MLEEPRVVDWDIRGPSSLYRKGLVPCVYSGSTDLESIHSIRLAGRLSSSALLVKGQAYLSPSPAGRSPVFGTVGIVEPTLYYLALRGRCDVPSLHPTGESSLRP